MLLAVDVGEALAIQRDGIKIYAGFDLKTTVRRSRRKTIFILLSLHCPKARVRGFVDQRNYKSLVNSQNFNRDIYDISEREYLMR